MTAFDIIIYAIILVLTVILLIVIYNQPAF